MVALDPPHGSPAGIGFPPAGRPKLHEGKFRAHVAAGVLALACGFVAGICIANPGVAVVRDSLIVLIVAACIPVMKRAAHVLQRPRASGRSRRRLATRSLR